MENLRVDKNNLPKFSHSLNSRISDRRVIHLRELFLSDLSYQWAVPEMAQKAAVSVSHLNRLFKTAFDLSPKQYLQELRLERSADLLKDSFLSVKEIRHSVGFSNKSIFIKSFKKRYGLTPVAYRKQRI